MQVNLIEQSGWTLVNFIQRKLEGKFLTQEQSLAICKAAIACVRQTTAEKVFAEVED